MLKTQIPDLYILEDAEKGRGVYCMQDIQADSIIEICPVIVLSKKDKKLIHQTKLHDYYFLWDEGLDTIAIPLGYGCLYNHASQANADTEQDLDGQLLRIIAKQNIAAGTEICINYLGGLVEKEGDLWF